MYQQTLTDKWLPFVVTVERQHYHVYMLLLSGNKQRKCVLRITIAPGIERKVVRIVLQVTNTRRFEILAKTTAVSPCSEVDVFPAMQRGYDIAKVSNSADLVSWVIAWLLCNNPHIVFIHFGFSYDILVLAAHALHILDCYFEAQNLGAIVVVDTFRYADKVHWSDFKSLSLDDMANHYGLGGKHIQPHMDIGPDTQEDISEMIFIRLPGRDCDAQHILQVIDWSNDRYASKVVSGARVLQPKRGYYSDVPLMDFASMYPTIMASVNISTETVHDLQSEMQGTHASVSSPSYVPFKRRSVKRELRSLVVNGQVQEGAVYWIRRIHTSESTLIERRTQVGKSTKPGWALKVAAISMYGSSVTSIGRWLVTVVEAVSYMPGYDIIYSDSDSVFECKREVIESVLSFTPMPSIKLEVEAYYSHFVLLCYSMGARSYSAFNADKQQDAYRLAQQYQAFATERNMARHLELSARVEIDKPVPENMKETMKGIASKRKDRAPIIRKMATA
ncbi:hypothetical protein DFJ73DRAFT_761928 [Zopfochytrium polystomum]|nr:hypothetical protein DFJ73DRAFT_761928 [Zopfochytrium polystomum]